MGFHFPVMPRLYMAMSREERAPIIDILRRTPDIRPDCQWGTFLRNHDELTLEMVTLDEREYMWNVFAPDPRMKSNLGIRRRLAPLMANNRAAIELLNALMLSLPGSPCIYYGDEIGMGDNIWLRDRNGVRTPMQWTADRNAGFSIADDLWAPIINDPIFGYEHVNVADQEPLPSSLLNWTRGILAIRREHRAFGRGSIEFILPDNPSILVYIRRWEDDVMLCAVNLANRVQSVAVDLSTLAGSTLTEAFGGTQFPPVGTEPYPLVLAPLGYYWFEVSTPQSFAG
jgi:maltose alpha-D-glucosyltransferase/alpha-amylase